MKALFGTPMNDARNAADTNLVIQPQFAGAIVHFSWKQGNKFISAVILLAILYVTHFNSLARYNLRTISEKRHGASFFMLRRGQPNKIEHCTY